MHAFVINLEGAADRWTSIEKTFANSGCQPVRVEAVNGLHLTVTSDGFSEQAFRRYHGRTTNLREVGCYLSHVEACRRFVQSGDPYGLICEDDILLSSDFPAVLAALLACSTSWDLVRLSGIGKGTPARVRSLSPGRQLMVSFGRLKGAGCYLVNRKAARAIVAGFLPMRVPLDHEIDREWAHRFHACSVQPFPVSQVDAGFRTSIQKGPSGRLSFTSRALFTYPYQVCNEVTRWIVRTGDYLRLRFTRSAKPNDGLKQRFVPAAP